jgi:hypothetical protein
LDVPTAGALATVVLELGATRQALAIEGGPDGAKSFSLARPDPGILYVLRYRCPLRLLGLQAGRLPLDTGLPLPPTDTVLSSSVSASGPLELEPVAVVPRALLDLRVARSPPSPCLQLEPAATKELQNRYLQAALFDRDKLLVLTLTGIEVLQLPTLTSIRTLPILFRHPPAVAVDADGNAHIAEMAGRVVNLSPSLELDVVEASTGTTALEKDGVQIALNPTWSGRRRLLMVNEFGRVDAFDGQAWSIQYTPSANGRRSNPGAVNVGPDHFVVSGPEAQLLVELTPDGRVETQRVVEGATQVGVSAIFYDPPIGVIPFLEDGHMLIPEGGRYRDVALRGIATRSVSTAATVDGGLLVGAHAGAVLSQYDYQVGECPSAIGVPLSRIEQVLRWGNKWVVLGNNDMHGTVVVLDPVSLPERCDSGTF